MVAIATSTLCEEANLVVQGHAQEEKLIAAAKGMRSSTVQLLITCQVKADARSENNRRLQVREGRGGGGEGGGGGKQRSRERERRKEGRELTMRSGYVGVVLSGLIVTVV